MTDTQAALPRWTVLPSDPPALRRWLAARSGRVRREDQGAATEDWPEEEPR